MPSSWRNQIMRIKITPEACEHQYRCENCAQSLPADSFYKSYLQSGRLRCRRCVSQLRQLHQDPYERIITTLRRSEKQFALRALDQQLTLLGSAAKKSCAGVIRRSVVKQAVTELWKGESAVRRSDTDQSSLVLVRWDVRRPFSYHNNILLTAKQAKQHYCKQLHSPLARELLYGPDFCKAVDELLHE